MALEECPECHGKVSTSAAHCPHCGFRDENPHQESSSPLIVISLILVGAFMVFVFWPDNDTKMPAQPEDPKTKTSPKLLKQTQRALDQMGDGGKCTSNGKEGIRLCAMAFHACASSIRQALKRGSKSQKARAKKLSKILSSKQAQIFPKLRDSYGPVVREIIGRSSIMKANNFSAWTIGDRYTLMEIWSPSMRDKESRRTIALTIQREVEDTLRLLRFSESRYKPSKHSNTFTYYKIESPDDHTIATWEGDRWRAL